MRLRRCAILMLEPREHTQFDFDSLAGGGTGLRKIIEWFALAPHAEGEITVDPDEVSALGASSPSAWSDKAESARRHTLRVVDSLIEKQLLVVEGSNADARDRKLRETHWHASPAVMHHATRWRGIDTEAAERLFVETTRGSLLERLGAAPPSVRERADAAERIPLPPAAASAFGSLLDDRVTCRNFDCTRALSPAQFSTVLYRAWGARTVHDYAPGVRLLKKGVPSAGGLHATGAYLLVQRVEGIEPGLYHYHPVDHALEPIRTLATEEAAALARRCVAAQGYFAEAQVLVLPVSRFLRTFWKYRNHAKAYRALILDVGHLSQTMYLAATELGLGAFITAAINEVDIEQAFGLDPLEESPLAACGFGIRAADCKEVEFDPLNAVWPAA